MKNLLTVWRLLDQRQRRKLIAMQLMSVLMAFSTVGGMAAILPFFTALSEPHAIANHAMLRFCYEYFHFTSESGFVLTLGVAFAAGIAVSNGVNLLGSLAIDRFAFALGDRLHVALFDEYLHRGYGFHLQTNSATLTSNVIHETGRVASGFLRQGQLFVTSLTTAVAIVGSIFWLDPLVAGITLGGLGASYAAVYAASRARLLDNGRTQSRYVTERTRLVAESFGAIRELLLYQAQRRFIAQFARCCAAISRSLASTLAISQSPRYALECLTACVLVSAALLSHPVGTGGGPWIANLSFIGLAVYRLLPALQQVFLAVVRMRSDSDALDTVAADLRLAQSQRPASPGAAVQPEWAGVPRREILLREVCFSHAGGRSPAISDLTLRIPAGAIVGFMGANGSGKTTLLDLLSGLLTASEGSIEIDGRVLDDGHRAAWQANIGYVPQQVFLCDTTVEENIAFGVAPAAIDGERMRTAVRLAGLERCIDELPNGYHEILGERGSRLSGGQRQKLGIARALYRDSALILMDEATSSLDPATELQITEALADHLRGKTVLIVAHRLEALRRCDVIYELANGRICRRGTYAQLVDGGSNATRSVGRSTSRVNEA